MNTNDFADIRPEEKELDIVHPGTGEKMGLKLKVMSMQDDRMKIVRRKLGDKHLAKRARNKNATTIEIEANQREIVLSAVTGWEWGKNEQGVAATFRGDQPEFSRTVLSELISVAEFIITQVDEFLTEEANFFQKSQTN